MIFLKIALELLKLTAFIGGLAAWNMLGILLLWEAGYNESLSIALSVGWFVAPFFGYGLFVNWRERVATQREREGWNRWFVALGQALTIMQPDAGSPLDVPANPKSTF